MGLYREVGVGARRAIKDVAAGLLTYTGLRRALTAYRRVASGGRRVLIVSYHRVVEDFTGEVQRSIPGLLISKETFRRHLAEAHAAGYRFASLGEALDVLSGRKVAKQDLCVVTFDDGYRDVYRHAFPILKAMGIPSIVYLPSDFIGTNKRFNHDRLFHLIRIAKARGFRPLYGLMPPAAAVLLDPIFQGIKTPSQALDDFIGEHPTLVLTQVIDALEAQLGGGGDLVPEAGDPMDWDEVRTMAASGVDFGAHTLGHCVLTLEDDASIDRELSGSKKRIEQEIGKPVVDFAYCNGWYSPEVIRGLLRNGFRSAVTTEDFPNRIGGDPYTLKRKVLWENFSIGMAGSYSTWLTGCQLDDVFGILGVTSPVVGLRRQSIAPRAHLAPSATEPVFSKGLN